MAVASNKSLHFVTAESTLVTTETGIRWSWAFYELARLGT